MSRGGLLVSSDQVVLEHLLCIKSELGGEGL